MATGILAQALPQVPGSGTTLYAIGEGLWLFTIGLFILFAGLYAARWIMFWDKAKQIFSHNTLSMFIGTIPMGLATIERCPGFRAAALGLRHDRTGRRCHGGSCSSGHGRHSYSGCGYAHTQGSGCLVYDLTNHAFGFF